MEDRLSHHIIGLAMQVHSRLGPGLLESAYEHCLCHELDKAPLRYARQVDLPLEYDGTRLDRGYRADLIVAGSAILEPNRSSTSCRCTRRSC
jgi:GxxExxY protein